MKFKQENYENSKKFGPGKEKDADSWWVRKGICSEIRILKIWGTWNASQTDSDVDLTRDERAWLCEIYPIKFWFSSLKIIKEKVVIRRFVV